LIAFVGACSSDDEAPQGTIGFVQGFLGGVAADEPLAAVEGRDILSRGGSAADAAVAVYFMLSVSMPSTASLGGGGVCIVRDPVGETTEVLDFLARPPKQIPAGASRPSAVPGNPRGFFALHSRFGRMRWEQLVARAENQARFGAPVSRAFANDLAQVGAALMAQPATRRIFGHASGKRLLREGETITQIELASFLGSIRRGGPGEFYTGALTRRFVEAVQEAGGSLELDDMRAYRPVWRQTLRVPFGDRTGHFAPPPAAAGTVAAQMFGILADDDRFAEASEDVRPHLLIEAALRAYAERASWLRPDGESAVDVAGLTSQERIGRLAQSIDSNRHTAASSLKPAPVERLENPSATSFVVIDRYGQTVACNLTMNNLFGTGRFAPGTGVLLAAQPGPAGRGPTSLGPMIVVNENVNDVYFAGTSSGGVTAPTSLINVAARTLLARQSLEDAMLAKRIHHGGVPDISFFENGISEAIQKSLQARGHRLARTPSLGRINAVHCGGGLRGNSDSCSILADVPPRGYGLATGAD
jgi:gamma-glutamyltranspeptidase / glutathione hydrolase